MHAVTSTHKILQSSRRGNRQMHNSRTKHLILQSICVGILAVGMSACTLSKAIDTRTIQSELITGSVTKTTEAEGVETGDTQIINSLVGENDQVANPTSSLAWQNPDTGNSGTILVIEKFIGPQGKKCKKFKTTIDSFMGISIYDGETCELKKGIWILSQFFRKKLNS